MPEDYLQLKGLISWSLERTIQDSLFGEEKISSFLSKFGNVVAPSNGFHVRELDMFTVVSCLTTLESWERNIRVLSLLL